MSTTLTVQHVRHSWLRVPSDRLSSRAACFTIEHPGKRIAAPSAARRRSMPKDTRTASCKPCPSAASRPSSSSRCRASICFRCEHTRQVKVPFADPRRTYTHAFERYALELSRFMTIQDVAQHLDVSWDTIKDIQKRNLQRRFGKPKLKNLKQIAIDEMAVGKGHHYFTVVLDLISGAVVFVGDGKGVEALTLLEAAAWPRAPRSGPWPPTCARPTSGPFASNLPKAVHVFDHFHVIKLFNDKLSAFRRELYRELTDDQRTQAPQGHAAGCS